MSVIQSIGRDLRQALRGLVRQPTYAFTAILTLALGIGASTAIFSVVYSVLIKPLPYQDADHLVRIRHSAPGIGLDDLTAAPSMYLTYRGENQTLASIGIWQESDVTLTDRGEPARVRALQVADGTLQALGVQPILGRGFTEQEHQPAAQGVIPVILSHAFWQQQFAGDPAVFERELSIDSQPARVVGVMPADTTFLDMNPPPQVILAVRLDPARQVLGAYAYQMIARLDQGVTISEATTDIERMLSIWVDQWPLFPGSSQTREDIVNFRITPELRPLKEDLVGSISSAIWVLMGAVGAVLLIACTNIANLLLVRANARRRDFAVRTVLGAGLGQIARALFAESAILSLTGGAIGLALAGMALRVLLQIGPSELPRLQEISLHWPATVFTVAVSVGSALFLGLITTLRYSKNVNPITIDGRGSSITRERRVMGDTFVIVQIAIALTLVIGATLMIRTLQSLLDVDPGFEDPSTIQTARVWIPTDRYPDRRQYTQLEREILDGIAALPGVASVGFASSVPIESSGIIMAVASEDQVPAAAQAPLTRIKYVSPGYFGAMGTRMIAGRDLLWSDIEAGGRVAIVSEDFARWISPEPGGAIGKRVRFADFGQDDWREVIGVAQNIYEDGLYEPLVGMVYWPVLAENLFNLPVSGTPSVTYAIRSERAGTATLVEEIRQAVRLVSSEIPVGQERTMRDRLAGSLSRTSFALVILSIAGGMALLLGVIGIYGVVAYVVAQKTREIGIRSALGAGPKELRRMFLFAGLKMTAIGVVIGLLVALVLARFMSSLLFGISAMDPKAYVVALSAMIVVSTVASYVPARRAASIDPAQSLKVE